MNLFDYFFENSKNSKNLLVLGSKEQASYEDVYRKSLQLACYLKNTYGEDKKILLIASNSVFFIVAYLAILKSGNVCVPLNPAIEEKNYLLIRDKCKSTIAFVSKNLKFTFSFSNCELLNENFLTELNEKQGQLLEFPISFDENRLAELIFTSGSTGLPKGVMISHKNIIANTNSIVQYLKITEKDIILTVLPFYYCYGLSLLHTHLRVGGSLVLNNSFMFIGSVINDLKNYNCTGFAGVPSHYQILLRKTKSFKTTQFPSLHYVTQAGGKLHTPFIEEFIQAFPDIRFNVMYGQTEATARLSYLPPEVLQQKIGSIGKGIPGVTLRSVNSDGQDVKPGEIGELIAFGDNVMLGYFEDEEATKEALKDSWLYTGDLAQIDEDGYFYLVARKKEIIKVGGNRISPKEIEEVLVSIPEVVDCIIEAEEDDILGEILKANIIVTNLNENTLTVEKVREYCSSRLISYKIPQKIIFKDKVEMSATGKKVK